MAKHVFEIPKWIAEICYFSKDYTQEVFFCEHSVEEVLDKIYNTKYDYVLMSLMNANQSFIEDIVKAIPFQRFLIGGYNEHFLRYLGERYENVHVCDTTRDTAQFLKVDFKFGTDYTLFKNEYTVPRLTLSYGCLNNCKFCIVPHFKIINVNKDVIYQQIDSFRDLNYRLIYLDDKTFGQADNYSSLKELKEKILREQCTDFNGFIVQTTNSMLVKKAKEFKDIGVSVVELGWETYNDSILRKYRKPSSEGMIRKSVEYGKRYGLKLIANIIIGFPEETEESYQKTYDFIMEQLKLGNIIGFNPAIYTNYDKEDNLGEIDFYEDEKTELHRKWWNKFNESAKNILEFKKIP
jgi:radical SAM superfamily enzyme YgiQ (UPF0313 family)